MKTFLFIFAIIFSTAAEALVYHDCVITDGPDRVYINQEFGTSFAKFNGRKYVVHINFGDRPMSTWVETYGGTEVFYTSINVLNPDGSFAYHGILEDLEVKCLRRK